MENKLDEVNNVGFINDMFCGDRRLILAVEFRDGTGGLRSCSLKLQQPKEGPGL